MSGGVLHDVGVRNLACLDDVGNPLCATSASRLGRTVGKPYRAIEIGEEFEGKTVLLGEVFVLCDGIKADAENDCTEVGELLDSITESTSLKRSPAGIGLRIEPKDDLLVVGKVR